MNVICRLVLKEDECQSFLLRALVGTYGLVKDNSSETDRHKKNTANICPPMDIPQADSNS